MPDFDRRLRPRRRADEPDATESPVAPAMRAGAALGVRPEAGNAAIARWVQSLSSGPDHPPRPLRAPAALLAREIVPLAPEDKAPPGHLWKSTIDGATFATKEEAERHEAQLKGATQDRTSMKGEKETEGRKDTDERERQERELRFSLALTQSMKLLLASVRFGAAAHWYDPAYWEADPGDEDALILKRGKRPSDAIAQLHKYTAHKQGYEGVESAKLDCVEIIEVGRWLAEMDVTGRKAFDEKYGSLGEGFHLAAPGSTGIQGTTLATRIGGESDRTYNRGGGPMTGRMMLTSATEKKLVDLAEHVATVPIGSRVMWRNFDKAFDDEHDFKNENTVKIGPDVYAAHPFGVFSLEDVAKQVGQGGFGDMQELLAEIAERAKTPPDDEKTQRQSERDAKTVKYYKGIDSLAAYIAKFVRIVEVETFASPV